MELVISGLPKDLKKIIREAEGNGWNFRRTKGGHVMARHCDGVRMAYISSTPSDRRALMNIKKDLGL